MKRLIVNAIIAAISIIIFLPSSGFGQEKKVRVKTVKIVDGEKVVNDTVFTVKEDENVEQNVFRFNDGAGFDIQKGDLGELKIMLEDQKDELKNMHIEFDEEKIIMLKELKELEALKKLDGLDALKELDQLEKIIMIDDIDFDIPEIDDFPTHHKFMHKRHKNDAVSEKELRDAGIKNKPDLLEVNDYNLNIIDGIVDFVFSLKTTGTPKVIVFNYFGDKVFTGKPNLVNGKYVIKIDLSNKQHGTYYLQVVLQDSSFTKKLLL
ncbi:MAG: hypothetical protein H8E34_01985 [Bacteroidetes bacterium]|nr:hypothetical protein [Bacteroidota bacterium]MBL6944003.1 hypothetical protein [Bacteroidales bacterium]